MSVGSARAATALVVTRASTVDGRTAGLLWDLYTTCFWPMQRRAAARHVLSRQDFELEVLDGRVSKYLARTADGTIVGLSTLSNDLTTVPWISPEFYRVTYPAHFARRAVFYCGLTMVHPDSKGSGAFLQMVTAFGRDVAAADGILAADMCRLNIDVVGVSDAVTLALKRAWGSATLVELDTQTYMAWQPPAGSLSTPQAPGGHHGLTAASDGA